MTAPVNSHSNASLSAIQYLVNEYGSVEKIPIGLLQKNGFSSAIDAKQAMDWKNKTGGTGYTSSKQGNAVLPNLVKDVGKGIVNIGLSNVAGTQNSIGNKYNLPNVASNSLAIGGPSNAPGSGLQDVAPLAGGAQYGQPAGSTLGAAHNAPLTNAQIYGAPGTGSTYDEQVPTGAGAGAGATTPGTTGTGITGTAPNYQNYLNAIPDSGGFVPYPVAPKFTPFHMTDFTPQAAGMTATAYSPAFAAIDLAKKTAQTNYGNSQAIVGGVFANLGKTIGQNATDLDAKYAAAKTATQADTAAAEAAASAPQKAAAATLAAGMQGAGQGKYAAQVNAQGNADAAWRVGQLAQQGLNDTTANTQYGLSADKANTGLQNAAATQGAFSKQQLAFDLANTLSSYDQNKLNLTSDEALKTLSLAQQLQGTDFQMQQGNYGMTEDYYKNQMDAASAQNQMAFNTRQMNYTQANTAYQNAYNTWKDTNTMGQAQQQLAIQEQQIASQQSQYNAGLVEKKYESDNTLAGMLARAAAMKGSGQASAAGPYGNFASMVGSITTPSGGLVDPSTAATVMNAVDSVAQPYITQGIKPPSAQAFVNDAVAQAQAQGVDPTIMRAAAWAYIGSGAATGWPGATQLGTSKP